MTDLLIVTTRSRLRSVRAFPLMLVVTRRVRRQLAGTEGLVRWASVVSGPTEFWTITAWQSRHAMQEFMRSDAHGDIMWDFSKLLSSLWLVRWRPTERESGTWLGVTLAPHAPEPIPPREFAWPNAATLPPLLSSSVGADGRISFESSPEARFARSQIKGVGGAVLAVQTSRLKAPMALRRLAKQRKQMFSDPALLRSVVGLGTGGACYLLSVWRTPADAARLIEGDWATEMKERYGERFWGNEWTPESEFGNWDGLRLRGEQIRVPHQPGGGLSPAVQPRDPAD